MAQYKIEYWYDRSSRCWITTVIDKQSNFEVDFTYDGNVVSRDYSIKEFQTKYNVTKEDTVKWKG